MRRLLCAVIGATVLSSAAAATPSADVRFATFNASLNRPAAGLLATQLADPNVDDQYRRQAKNVAEVVQRIAPDVLLVNEFDPLDNADAPVGPEELLRDNFLEVSQNGATPIDYPYAFIAPSNTGVATGKDLNNNGVAVTTPGALGYGDDAFGFGAFPGQFGMVVFSKYPILVDQVRTFQLFKWKDMPGKPDSDPVLLAGRGRDPSSLLQEPLGRADPDRREGRALPRLASDATRVRRARGQERPPEPRRDPLLGRLHLTRPVAATSTTTRESAAV